MFIVKKRNYFKMELWLFVLLFLLIFSVMAGAEEQTAPGAKYLQKISICKDILEKNPLRETNYFVPQDDKVITWLRFSYNSAEKFKLYWEWITPEGKFTIVGKWRWRPVNIKIIEPGIG